jgi:hypothetical protein
MDPECTWAARDICARTRLAQIPTNRAHPLRDRRATSNPSSPREELLLLTLYARGGFWGRRCTRRTRFGPTRRRRSSPRNELSPCPYHAWTSRGS